MKRSNIYLLIVLAVYAAFVVVFTTFPRSTFSELEKRELETFPLATFNNVKSGEFTKNVSRWFSDSEPYRDKFMSLSMIFGDNLKLRLFNDEQSTIKFHATNDDAPIDAEMEMANNEIEGYSNNITANENAKIANKGIIIVGEGNKVRALMSFGGGPEGGAAYANACNKYQKVFGKQAKIYCLVVPTAVEFYCPDAAKGATKPQLPTIKALHKRLNDSVIAVNAYTPLANHVKEDIYLRTDHHWAPLGAYYVAQELARVAHVPFRDLNSYDKKVVHGYVGSMYGYSHDISVKNSPEDFVYYVPRDVDYTTTYIKYNIDKDFKVVGENPPHKGKYFLKYPDGSGGAYCTFMGSDSKITHIHTSTKNGRRMLIIKDSFGNALPGYLFYSFEDIHVIDFRYFSKNLKKYVTDNKITDIVLFAVISRAYGGGGDLIRFINQPDGTYNGLTGKNAEKNKASDKPKPVASKPESAATASMFKQ